MQSQLQDRSYTADDTLTEDELYDIHIDDDEDYMDAVSGRSRVMRLLVIAVVVLVVTLGVLYGVVPVVTEWLQPDLPPLAPAVQT